MDRHCLQGSFQVDKSRNAEFGNFKDLRTVPSPSPLGRNAGSALGIWSTSRPRPEHRLNTDTAGELEKRAPQALSSALGLLPTICTSQGDVAPHGGGCLQTEALPPATVFLIILRDQFWQPRVMWNLTTHTANSTRSDHHSHPGGGGGSGGEAGRVIKRKLYNEHRGAALSPQQ